MCIWRNVFEETWAPVISALQEMKTKHVSDELTKKNMFFVPSFNYVIASKIMVMRWYFTKDLISRLLDNIFVYVPIICQHHEDRPYDLRNWKVNKLSS